MKDSADKYTIDMEEVNLKKKDKTAAARMARYRAKRAAEFPINLRDAYMKGFNDAHADKNPAPCETWINGDAALAYICGGMDAANV